ncbi:MAG TPA: TonB-dependent receptor [Terriglobia bacterium]|nr:TonB-dependent receptor [Terriglobia bacterium]
MRNRLAAAVVLLILAAGIGWASVTASISGTVTDSSGAVVPRASVIARNTDTGIATTTHTDTQGFYSLPVLATGKYELTIKATGFEEYQQTGVVLDINTALRIDAVMKVGAVTQEVKVSATAVHVDTTSTQMGEVIAEAKITAVPLNGRSYTDLLALQPGVAPASSGASSVDSVSGNLNPGNISISGQRESANGFMINGANAEENFYMAAGIIPNLDSIAEFRILTNNADAEYGNYSGGLVNVITKSGTNKFHGSAFEFVRTTDFDARNFYAYNQTNPLTGAAIPGSAIGALHQNQFGGTGGGPILHDKVFFFADYQGTRQVQGVDSGLLAVPSAQDRTGNLSDVASRLTGTVNGTAWASSLSNELGYPVAVGEPYYKPGCTSATCVFPGAIIPQSIFPTPANALMKYIPLPNVGSDFSTSAFKGTLGDNKASGRLDANTRLGMITGYYYIDDYVQVNPYGGASLPGFSTTNNGRNQMINFSITKSIGSDSVNDLRLNYMRDVIFQGYPQGGLGVSTASQGFTGIFLQQPNIQGVESIGFNSFSLGSSNAWSQLFDNTYQVLDNYSKVIGTHTIKLGGNVHYDQVAYLFNIYPNGGFGFNGSETGVDFADFLIGAPSQYQQGDDLPIYSRARYFALYGQDSWRATPHLTLNYGLRWEVSTPWWETHNELETLVPGLQSKSFPGAPAGWDFPGDPGIPSTLSPTRYDNFSPRIGLAYSPHSDGGFWSKVIGAPGQTSVRAAWGRYSTSFENIVNKQEQGDAPFGYFWSSPSPPQFTTPFINRETDFNEGQRFPVPVPPLNVSPSNPDTALTAADWAKEFEPIASSPGIYIGNHVPYGEDYNISLQREFGSATMISVSYVGSEGHKLLSTIEANPSNPALCMSLSQPSEVMPGTATCGPYSETGLFYPVALNGTGIPVRQRFGAAFGGDGWFSTIGNSNYNSLQVSLRHAVGHLEFLAGYTYSKTMDNASGDGLGQGDNLNPENPAITRALSAFDVAHNFVVSYNYRIPFEKLWRPNRLTSGWQVSGITRFATGFPVYIQEPDDHSLLGTFQSGQGNPIDEPNFTPGNLDFKNPRTAVLPGATPGCPNGCNSYFNTSLFSEDPVGQLGDASRRFFTGPGWNNWDMALVKDLRLTETVSLQFRGEFFNTFNHAQFGGVTGNYLSSTFGFVTSANAPRIGQIAARLTF